MANQVSHAGVTRLIREISVHVCICTFDGF